MTDEQPSLRIAIAAAGRFHVLDLARELDALGYHVRFYSYVPRRRAQRFGLPARCHVPLLPWAAPCLALTAVLRRLGCTALAELFMYWWLDLLVAWKLQACDAFIGMSGIYARAFEAARKRYGAKLIVERGSVHIEMQRDILKRLRQAHPATQVVPPSVVRREVEAYASADRISVPSLHAEASFIAGGFPASKLFRNPYGADLAMFTPDPGIRREPGLLLFVGGWSFQKGVDVLVRAMYVLAERGFRLCHVGSVNDAPLPDAPWFQSLGPVDQAELPQWYRRARCLVLPSRQEGLSLVQIQALACGCPIVGTTMTGARDLHEILGISRMVQVAPVDDAPAIVAAVTAIASDAPPNPLNEAQRARLGWPAYGRRYAEMLQQLVHADASRVHRKDGPACA